MAELVCDSVERGNPTEKLTLFGFDSVNQTVGSRFPFVGRVKAFLRMNEIPYGVIAVKETARNSPKKMVWE